MRGVLIAWVGVVVLSRAPVPIPVPVLDPVLDLAVVTSRSFIL